MFSVRKAQYRQFCDEQNHMTRRGHDILAAISRMIRHLTRADFSSVISSAPSVPHVSINVQPTSHSRASPRFVVKLQTGDIRIDYTVVPARSYPPQGDFHLLGPLPMSLLGSMLAKYTTGLSLGHHRIAVPVSFQIINFFIFLNFY